MKEEKISPKVIERLTKYLRLLETQNGEAYISSEILAEKMGYTAAQVRKDLSNFGEFGIRGKGYNIGALYKDIKKVLGVDKQNNIIVVGMGRLGEAMLSEPEFSEGSFDIVGVFDSNSEIIGKEIKGHVVKDASELSMFIRQNNVDIVIIAVPTNAAQETLDVVVREGVKAVLNFAPTKLDCPKSVSLQTIDFYAKLQEINYWREKK